MKAIPLPISSAEWPTLYAPIPMSETAWKEMMALLEAVKAGLVKAPQGQHDSKDMPS